MKVKRMAVFCALLATVALSACGASSNNGGDTKTVVTIVKTEPAQPGNDTSSTDNGVSDEGTGGSSGGGGDIAVPNEVGKQHQAAQDDLQAHGLYNLSEEDATGQGRLLIIDRNWKVVSQSPASGTRVSEDATITLRSKKYTDP